MKEAKAGGGQSESEGICGERGLSERISGIGRSLRRPMALLRSSVRIHHLPSSLLPLDLLGFGPRAAQMLSNDAYMLIEHELALIDSMDVGLRRASA